MNEFHMSTIPILSFTKQCILTTLYKYMSIDKTHATSNMTDHDIQRSDPHDVAGVLVD